MRCFSLLAGALFAGCLLGVYSAALPAQPVSPPPPIRRWGGIGAARRMALFVAAALWPQYRLRHPGIFRRRVLCGGDMPPTVNELPGSAAVVQAVAASVNAIGYTSMGFHASGVKWLAIIDATGHTLTADAQTLRRGGYPFPCPLYLYVNKPPGKPLDPLTLAFLARVLSPEGQDQVNQAGYSPLTESQRLAARRAARAGCLKSRK